MDCKPPWVCVPYAKPFILAPAGGGKFRCSPFLNSNSSTLCASPSMHHLPHILHVCCKGCFGKHMAVLAGWRHVCLWGAGMHTGRYSQGFRANGVRPPNQSTSCTLYQCCRGCS